MTVLVSASLKLPVRAARKKGEWWTRRSWCTVKQSFSVPAIIFAKGAFWALFGVSDQFLRLAPEYSRYTRLCRSRTLLVAR
jgi:hypothetical protein